MRSLRVLAVITILAGGCLAGCGRGSAAGTQAENILPAKPGAAAIDPADVAGLVDTARNDLSDSAFWRLGDDVEQLHKLPSDRLSQRVNLQRNQAVEQLEQVLMARWAERWAASNQAGLFQRAQSAVAQAMAGAPERFQDAVTEVTEDAIRGVACKEVSNLATMTLSPPSANQPDDQEWPGDVLSAGDIISDAETILGGTISPYLGSYMNWNTWYGEVTDFAGEAAQAISGNQSVYLNVLSNPAGQRAAYAYVSYCYAPPVYQQPE
jgi:hypothetical protein